MATGPVYRTVGTRSQSAGAITLTPALPTVDTDAGGILVCIVTSKNNATHSTATGGWTKQGQMNSGASFTVSLFTAPQGSAAPVITWAGSVACSAIVSYYTSPDGPVEYSSFTSATGTTTTHGSLGFNTSRDTALVLLVDASAANTGLTTPSGWTAAFAAGSGTDAGNTSIKTQAFPTSGTATGSTSSTGANAAYVMFQIELRNTIATNQIQVSKVEASAWYEPKTGLAASKIEVGVWYEPKSGLATSKIEVSAWYEPTTGMVVGKLDNAVWLDLIQNLFEVSKIEVEAWIDPNAIFVAKLDVYGWLDVVNTNRRMIMIR